MSVSLFVLGGSCVGGGCCAFVIVVIELGSFYSLFSRLPFTLAEGALTYIVRALVNGGFWR